MDARLSEIVSYLETRRSKGSLESAWPSDTPGAENPREWGWLLDALDEVLDASVLDWWAESTLALIESDTADKKTCQVAQALVSHLSARNAALGMALGKAMVQNEGLFDELQRNTALQYAQFSQKARIHELIDEQELDEARKLVDELIETGFTASIRAAASVAKVRWFVAKGDTKQGQSLGEKILPTVGSTTERVRLLSLLGRLATESGDLNGGITRYKQAFMTRQEDTELLETLSELYAKVNNGRASYSCAKTAMDAGSTHAGCISTVTAWKQDHPEAAQHASLSKNDLGTAIENGDAQGVQHCLEGGVFPDIEVEHDGWKHTALHAAIRQGNPQVVEVLAQSGADLTDATKETDDARVLELLLAHGAPLEITAERLVNAAARNGTFPLVRFLLENGADINAQTESGETALMRATGNGCAKVLSYLVQEGADLQVKNSEGERALEHCTEGSLCYRILESAMNGQPKTPFFFIDLERLKADFLNMAARVRKLASTVGSETFYAAAIDGGCLVLNSEEKFAETLKRYQQMFDHYSNDEKIEDLKHNVGDWSYHLEDHIDPADEPNYSFASLQPSSDVDDRLYKEVMAELIRENADEFFQGISRTRDFYVGHPDHVY